ncbi:EamA family transporter [Labedella endophytica]|uniref:EamA/RhaT family transporter n=1 Tax=Labedella endophytica TaxID=1523160 RepID=A0A433JWX0_9MICO|nr:EamA family transporter [Labedella endophytica]RUR03463.1 EamA/RhaT family transporter [Labedella endophytica]
MITVVLGLVGALVFGAADFLGGLSSKRISAVLTTAVSAVAGLVILGICALVVPGEWSTAAAVWGALSGVTGALAVFLLYACLAIGPMSILSPLTAVVSAVVPVTWGFIGGERLGPLAAAAIGLALVSVVLVGFVPEKGAVRPSAKGLIMAVASGALIGTFFILLDQTPDDSGLLPLVLNRGVNAAIMFTAFGIIVLVVRRGRARRAEPRPSVDARPAIRNGLALALACGALDGAANAVILVGLRAGDLSVMSVLIAMYPAGTILLAAVVLRERIAPLQWVGLALALAAAGILAVA